MYMVAAEMVMDLITPMAITLVDLLTWVDHNHHHTDNKTILIDTNHMQHGEQAEMDLVTATVVQEVEKVSS